MDIARLLQLRRRRGDHFCIRVANDADGGAAAGIEDFAAVGEVEVCAGGVCDEVRVDVQRAVEESWFLLRAVCFGDTILVVLFGGDCFRCHLGL